MPSNVLGSRKKGKEKKHKTGDSASTPLMQPESPESSRSASRSASISTQFDDLNIVEDDKRQPRSVRTITMRRDRSTSSTRSSKKNSSGAANNSRGAASTIHSSRDARKTPSKAAPKPSGATKKPITETPSEGTMKERAVTQEAIEAANKLREKANETTKGKMLLKLEKLLGTLSKNALGMKDREELAAFNKQLEFVQHYISNPLAHKEVQKDFVKRVRAINDSLETRVTVSLLDGEEEKLYRSYKKAFETFNTEQQSKGN